MDAFNKFEYMAELCDLALFKKDLFDLLFTASQENICLLEIPVLWVYLFDVDCENIPFSCGLIDADQVL